MLRRQTASGAVPDVFEMGWWIIHRCVELGKQIEPTPAWKVYAGFVTSGTVE